MLETILITGGTGFIGSHTCLDLIHNGFRVILLDNLENSSIESVKKIKQIIYLKDKNLLNNIEFILGDIRDERLLNKIFNKGNSNSNHIYGVIHFAGLKSVSESTSNPIKYWDYNLVGTITLLKVMNKFNCKNIVFSSSATIYGLSNYGSLKENFKNVPINTYGETKYSIEKMLFNIFKSDEENWQIINLRYFNPIGAHSSGLLGENPRGKTENLFPILCEVASRKRNELIIYGNNWPTSDGTCERDFIHIMDIAEAHTKAIEHLFSSKGFYCSLNIGTGKSTSVLQLIRIFENVNDVKIQFSFAKKRVGDVPILCADVGLAKKVINWTATRNIEEMCIDGWGWYKSNLK